MSGLALPHVGLADFGLITCVGGPCAGTRVPDGGTDLVRVPVPRDFRWSGGEPVALTEQSWATYQRCVMDFGAAFSGAAMVLVPEGVDSPALVIAELLRGYNPPRP